MSSRLFPTSVIRDLWSLATPVIGINVLSVLALAVDTLMCGYLPDNEAVLAALGFSTQFVFLLFIAIMGLSVGAMALVSRAHGAGDADRVRDVLGQAVIITAIAATAVTAITIPLSRPILSLLGATPDLLDRSNEYLLPLLLGTPSTYLMVLLATVMRGVGQTRIPFLCALVGNLINIGINYCLILGNLGFPSLGLRGAGIGTVIAHTVNMGLLFWVVRKEFVPGLCLRLRPVRLNLKLAGELFRVGAPASMNMVVINASFLSIVGMIGRIDGIAVAAHGIGMRIQSLAFVPGLSIAQATAALVGQALGAGDVLRARQVARVSAAMCAGIMTTIGIPFVIAAIPIVGLFQVAPGSVLEGYAVEWIMLLGAGMLPVGLYIAYVGLLDGAGVTGLSLRINLSVTFFVQIPLSALLGFTFGFGITGIWVAFPISLTVKAIWGYLVYRSDRWEIVGAKL